MKDFATQINELGEDKMEIEKFQSELSNGTAKYTLAVLSHLIETLEQAIGKLLIANSKNVYFDKELGGNIKSTISEVLSVISNIKAPEVNVAVDLGKLHPIVSEITRQNALIIPLVQKLNSNGVSDKTDALYKLVTQMVEKSNAFVEKVFNKNDYTEQLVKIGEGVSRNPVSYEGKITKRNQGLIDEFYIRPVK